MGKGTLMRYSVFVRRGDELLPLDVTIEHYDDEIISVSIQGVDLSASVRMRLPGNAKGFPENLVDSLLMGRPLYSADGSRVAAPWSTPAKVGAMVAQPQGVVTFFADGGEPGTTKIVMDDVRADELDGHPKTWKLVSTYTENQVSSIAVASMAFNEQLIADAGMNVLQRVAIRRTRG